MHGESREHGPVSPKGDWHPIIVVALLWGMCLSYSLLRAPIPGPNEPHYLAKARHFWEPEWCAGDLFLESSNPHAVFYALIGWLPELVGFETTALIGRIAATLVFAIGWYALAWGLRLSAAATVIALSLLLAFQALGNLSGEWIIGGVEAKTFSYALAFLGWGLMMRGKLFSAALSLGACFSFHPVIGGWVLLATLMAASARFIFRSRPTPPTEPRPARSPIVSWLGAAGMTVLAMLPGLWASWPVIRGGSSPESDLLQVEKRLAHHLDPLAFPLEALRYYALLLVICGLAIWIGRLQRMRPVNSGNDEEGGASFLRWIVAASVLFAIAGIAIAWGKRPFGDMPGADWRAGLLKFYPFRLVDILLPTLAGLEIGRAVSIGLGGCGMKAGCTTCRLVTLLTLAIALPLLLTWRTPYADRPASQMTAEQETDWREVCEWVREHTPQDALLWTADERWAIKWYVERAEYVNYKDCPQDSVSINEWRERQLALRKWHLESYADGGFSIAEMRRLQAQTEITHLIWDRAEVMPSELPLLYQAGDFRVYELP